MNGKEILREKQLIWVAREWVARYEAKIEAILEEAWLREKEIRTKLGLYADLGIAARGFELRDDLYANPFCNAVVEAFEGCELGRDIYVKRTKVVVEGSQGEVLRIVPFHVRFAIEYVEMDATFGQFVDLDEAICMYPEMFVGRILVARSREVQKRFGLRYVV